jgi:hypothetical protein
MTDTVEFGSLPGGSLGDRRRNPVYGLVHDQLAARPGVWAKVAHVPEKRDAAAWYSAGRKRGWQVSQRRGDDGVGFDVWAMLPGSRPLMDVLEGEV